MRKTAKQIVICAALLMIATGAQAQYFQRGGIFYNVTSNTPPRTVEVTYDTSLLTKYSGNITIPDSVTAGVTYRVTKIGHHSFNHCDSLTSITIPASVLSIGDSAYISAITQVFYGCTNLNYVNYTGTLDQWCDISFTSIYDNPINQAKSLHINGSLVTTLNIPNTRTSILPYTFVNDTAITTVTIPSSVQTIGNHAFYGCSNMRRLNMSNNILHINNHAFYNCHNLDTFVFPDSLRTIGTYALGNCRRLHRMRNIVLPPKIERIGNYAFYFGNSNTDTSCLERIDIPTSLKYIGQLITIGPTRGFSVYYQGTLDEWIRIERHQIFMSEYRLFINNQLQNCITIPNTIDSIKPFSFAACIADSMIIGNSVRVIDSGAFQRCTMKYLSLPDSLKRIGYKAFVTTNNLDNIYIPAGTIGPEAFSDHYMNLVTIGEGVDTIFEYAFYPPSNHFCSYYLKDTTPPVLRSTSGSTVYAHNVFRTSYTNAFFYFPCGYSTNYMYMWPNSGLGFGTTRPSYMESPYYCFAYSAEKGRGTATVLTQADCSSMTCTVQATAFQGYKFAGWSNGSTNPNLALQLTQDTVIIAHFATLNFAAYPDDTLKGSVNILVYPDSTTNFTALLQAVPKPGYVFARWSNGETDSIISFTQTTDTVLVAYFQSPVSIVEANVSDIQIKTEGRQIILGGLAGEQVLVSDVLGRIIYNASANGRTVVTAPAKGVYFIKTGSLPARKIAITQ